VDGGRFVAFNHGARMGCDGLRVSVIRRIAFCYGLSRHASSGRELRSRLSYRRLWRKASFLHQTTTRLFIVGQRARRWQPYPAFIDVFTDLHESLMNSNRVAATQLHRLLLTTPSAVHAPKTMIYTMVLTK